MLWYVLPTDLYAVTKRETLVGIASDSGVKCSMSMSIDKQGGKSAFVCDVCSARFEAEATDQQPGGVHELWIAAKKLGWHVRQQRGGKWHTACPECATDDWKLWNW
jgi:hypothetical protein